MDIQLNFINQSNDQNNSNIVIFQKNNAPAGLGDSQTAVAWTVFNHPVNGQKYPFTFSVDISVAAADSFGTVTAQQDARDGGNFNAVNAPTGFCLLPASRQLPPGAIEVTNQLPMGSINAMVYRSERLVSMKAGVAPGQAAGFLLEPSINILVAPGTQQGQLMTLSSLSIVPAYISLLGIRSADIVMTGGGSGTDAQPIRFFPQNVIMA